MLRLRGRGERERERERERENKGEEREKTFQNRYPFLRFRSIFALFLGL